jgi:hypothetical protein
MDAKSCSTCMLGALLAGALVTAGCGSPCQGSDCASSSTGSGNFMPGPFPHSAAQLDGVRCARSTPTLEIFVNNLFTEPDPPTVVHVADLLTVYWSVCNTGNDNTVSSALSNVYDFVVTRTTDASEVSRQGFDVPQLSGCQCQVVSRQFNGGSGNSLPAAVYKFSLARIFDADVNRVINN